MATFDEEKQKSKVAQLRAQEEEDVARILSTKYGAEYIDLTSTTVSVDALRYIPEERARLAEAVCFNVDQKQLQIGVKSPNKPETKTLLNDLKEKGFDFKLYMVSNRSLETAWMRYKDLSYATKTSAGALSISDEEISNIIERVKSAEDARTFIEETLKLKRAYRVSHIVEVFLGAALATNASDIHIEPSEDNVRLRFRLDGLLTDIHMFDRDTYHLLLSRVKLLSGLKLNIKNEAQDGRFSIKMSDVEIEIRTSILPGEYGETMVLRILNPNAIKTSIEELGMHPRLLEKVLKEIDRPTGMIINTGPTGSGKTTTLYAFLSKVHSPDIKVITIEDPIEYHLGGIVQTQVDREKNYTFASGLRASLRQDPDVIMIGEIRDTETAEIAVHASLTGHVVFSTLHTNSAVGAFPRLIDMGINPQTLGPAMNLVMAQRLVRKLCPECRKPHTPEGRDKLIIDHILETFSDTSYLEGVATDTMWNPEPGNTACPTCGGVGYKGRVGIFEAIIMTEEISDALRNMASEREILELAGDQHILSMREDGLIKILTGITSLEEVRRVIDLE